MKVPFDQGLIRDWSRVDIPDLVEFASNEKISRNLTAFPYPYTESDGMAWLERLEAMRPPTHWAIEVEGRAVGGIGLEVGEGKRAQFAELGYWLGEAFWGRGIATSAVRALVPGAMSRFGLIRVEAHAYEWNRASMRVLEKVGFQLEGRLRKSVVVGGEAFDEMIYGYVDDGA